MARSKLSVIISILSLVVATGCVVMLLASQRGAPHSNSHLSATDYVDDEQAGQPPVAIEPVMVKYSQTAQIAVDYKKVLALAIDADDRIYVAGDKSFCRFSPDGNRDIRVALSDEPTCLNVGNRQHMAPGRIYVGFVNHVEVFEPNGSESAFWQGIERAKLTSISSGDHEVFLADSGQSVVERFDWTGKLLEPFGESNPHHFTSQVNGANAPFDLVVGTDDLIYVANRRDHRVEGYTLDGTLERHWGQGSPAIEDFAGLSNPAHLAITADGGFVTAEEDPLRVKIYSRGGQYEGVVCGPDETGPVVAIAADHQNRILVLDGQARCVRVFEVKKPAAKKKE